MFLYRQFEQRKKSFSKSEDKELTNSIISMDNEKRRRSRKEQNRQMEIIEWIQNFVFNLCSTWDLKLQESLLDLLRFTLFWSRFQFFSLFNWERNSLWLWFSINQEAICHQISLHFAVVARVATKLQKCCSLSLRAITSMGHIIAFDLTLRDDFSVSCARDAFLSTSTHFTWNSLGFIFSMTSRGARQHETSWNIWYVNLNEYRLLAGCSGSLFQRRFKNEKAKGQGKEELEKDKKTKEAKWKRRRKQQNSTFLISSFFLKNKRNEKKEQ